MGRTRPTKAMMLAANAAIDGDTATVDQLIKENDLNCSELEERLAIRNGRKYEFGRKLRRKSETAKRAPTAAFVNTRHRTPLNVTINGRTSIRQLFCIISEAERAKAQAQQALKRRPAKEIEAVRKAVAEIDVFRRKRDELERRIREAEEAL